MIFFRKIMLLTENTIYYDQCNFKYHIKNIAREWTLWEMGTSKLLPDTKYMDKADNLDFAAAFARIECHYFVNGIFLEEAFILKNVDKILNIPVDIVQGRYDVVCPATSAWELHQVIFFENNSFLSAMSLRRTSKDLNSCPPPPPPSSFRQNLDKSINPFQIQIT